MSAIVEFIHTLNEDAHAGAVISSVILGILALALYIIGK